MTSIKYILTFIFLSVTLLLSFCDKASTLKDDDATQVLHEKYDSMLNIVDEMHMKADSIFARLDSQEKRTLRTPAPVIVLPTDRPHEFIFK
jgi:hypothetical protein